MLSILGQFQSSFKAKSMVLGQHFQEHLSVTNL